MRKTKKVPQKSIDEKYSNLCKQLGDKDYKIFLLNQEKATLYTELYKLSIETMNNMKKEDKK